MDNKKEDNNNGSIKQNIFSNVSSMLSAKIINILCGVVVSILLARYLGAERQGIISYALSIYGMFSFFAVFGLPDIIVREFSQNREQSKEIAKSAMMLIIVGGILASVLSIYIAVQLKVTSQVFLFVVLYSVENLFQFLRVFEQWFYSIAKTKFFSIAQIITHLLFLGVKVIGIVLKQDMIWFVLCTVLEAVFTNVSLLICYRIINQPFSGRGKITINKIKFLLKSCWPLIIVSAANTIYMRIDQLMIGKMINETDLGVYSVGVTLAEYWYFVPSIIYTSFLPALSKQIDNKYIYYNLLQKFADVIVSVAYLAIAGFSFWGKILIPILYGNEYIISSTVLLIYIWAGLFICMSYIDQVTYITINNTKTIMFIGVTSAILNILLNLIFIPIMGIYGAALATTLDQMLIRCLVITAFWKKFKDTFIIQLKALFPFKRLYLNLKAIRTKNF